MARRVRVTVKNKTFLPKNFTDELRAHEAVHRQINETEARRIETDLSSFRTPTADADAADALFKQSFYRAVRKVDDLHTEWDANHIPH